MNALWQLIRPYLSGLIRYLHISYLEAQSEYQGSYIGIAWIPLSTLIFSAMLALVFRHSEDYAPAAFFLYVLCGYTFWGFITDSIGGSTDILQKKLDFAVHSNLTVAGLFGKTLIDRVFDLALNLVVLLGGVLLIHPAGLASALLLAPPFFVMLVVTSLAVSYLTNLFTIFVPEAMVLVKTAMRFLFFATPVFWVPDETSSVRKALVDYNPATYYLQMSRQVFGVEPFNGKMWLVGSILTVVITLAGAFAFVRSERFVRNIK